MKQPPIILSRIHRAPLAASLALVASAYAACESSDEDPIQGPGTGMMSGPALTGDAAIGSGLDAGLPRPGVGGTFGGASGTAGGTVLGGAGTGGTAGAGGTTGMNPGMTDHDHCMTGYPVDPRDSQLTGEPDEWKASNGAIDLVLPKAVVSWMQEGVWEKSHDAWHNIRRCQTAFGGAGGAAGGFIGGLLGGLGGGAGGGGVEVCSHTELVPADQECENAEDGYQFLVMHRHMIQGLKQAFPTHKELFEGFPRFPFQASDVPEQWRSRWRPWSQQVLDMANRLEGFEQNLSRPEFATEGALGKYIQCGIGAFGANSVHGAMHFQWQVAESPHDLGKQAVNIDNYMFWKLHGWIDDIWERYRMAKGLKPDEPKLLQALQGQCMEMHQLAHLFEGASPPPATEPLPVEKGYFQEQVRPVLDKYCGSCHSGTRPQSNLLLGGQVSSAAIVQNIVAVPTVAGGQFQRVVPGSPEQSWLYLKIAGTAASVGCRGACNTGFMPPTGQVTLTAAELEVFRKWIADGAPPPTQ